MTKLEASEEEKKALIEKALRIDELRKKLGRPLYARMDYTQIARKTFVVDPLPQGAFPVYDKDPEPLCLETGHDGFGKPMSHCEHPECVARYVLET